jgi:hypothetical protein
MYLPFEADLIKITKANIFKRRSWLYDKGDNDTLRDKLLPSDLHSLLSYNIVDESADMLSKTIIQEAQTKK